MIKNLILPAIILITSAFSAEHEHTDISILDGFYGFRQEICQDSEQLNSAQKKVNQLFIQEIAEFASIHVQLESFFSDSPFNAYFAEKLKTLTSQWMFFQGHQGVNFPVLDYDIQDKPAIIGHHYTLVKEIAEIDAIIKKATEKNADETAKGPDLKTQQQDLQLRADLYALNKYIFYKNLNHQLNQETKHNPDVALKMACLYLQNRAGIWKSRVSTQPSSLADQLGLIGTLYNPEFNAGNAGMEKMSFYFLVIIKHKNLESLVK